MKTAAFLLTVFGAVGALAADAPPVAKMHDAILSSAEKEIVSLAEAMPADKYDFAPTQGAFQGVRTFGQQVKHLAAVVYMVSAASLGEKPPVDTGNENGPADVKTKQQIVDYLKASFAYAHKAMNALTAENENALVPSPFGQGKMMRGSAADVAVWHSFDHYGQMVVYARMNGIIPPASAGK
jgi:hypothetical protein